MTFHDRLPTPPRWYRRRHSGLSNDLSKHDRHLKEAWAVETGIVTRDEIIQEHKMNRFTAIAVFKREINRMKFDRKHGLPLDPREVF